MKTLSATGAELARHLPSPTLSALSDEELRTQLRRAAEQRMNASTPRAHDHAGRMYLEVIDELTRRQVPLW